MLDAARALAGAAAALLACGLCALVFSRGGGTDRVERAGFCAVLFLLGVNVFVPQREH